MHPCKQAVQWVPMYMPLPHQDLEQLLPVHPLPCCRVLLTLQSVKLAYLFLNQVRWTPALGRQRQKDLWGLKTNHSFKEVVSKTRQTKQTNNQKQKWYLLLTTKHFSSLKFKTVFYIICLCMCVFAHIYTASLWRSEATCGSHLFSSITWAPRTELGSSTPGFNT